MSTRITRSNATGGQKELRSEVLQLSSPPMTPLSNLKRSMKTSSTSRKPPGATQRIPAKLPVTPNSTRKCRQSKAPRDLEDDDGEKPQINGNLTPASEQEIDGPPSKRKATALRNASNGGVSQAANPSGSRVKAPKKKGIAPYTLALHDTPFPDYKRPTREECNEVHRVLTELHGDLKPPAKIPEPSVVVAGCGLVPSVLDAVIRTLLSAATNNRNSSAAVQGLAKRFGVLKDGVGKGSIDWNAVRVAPVEDIFEAIKVGGLANNKSKNIKQLLNMVYEENQERRAALLSFDDPAGTDHESKDAKDAEIKKAEQHVLTLDHLHLLPDQEVLEHLVRYPGVAHKTAKCVAMFCMGRKVFPVDTHIFRITKWLGWFPEGENNNAKAQAHMEVRIPDELKYPLHRLFIRHGQQCPRCIAGNHPGSNGWDDGCVIEHLVKRTGKNAGHSVNEVEGVIVSGKRRTPKKAKGGKRRRYEESDDVSDDSEPLGDDNYED